MKRGETLSGLARAREFGYDGKGTYQDWYNNQRVKESWHNHGADGLMGFGQQTRGEKKLNLIHPVGRVPRCVWKINTRMFSGAHFATFPEALVEPIIKAGSKEGDVVLDPFAGACTTGVVCKKLKRNFIGIEINPEYVKLGQERIDKTL